MAKRNPEWADILWYPAGYEDVPESEINGCGPKNWGFLFRDNVFGVCFTEASNIHDGCCEIGYVSNEFTSKMYLENMKRTIRHSKVSGWRKNAARGIAQVYYQGVRMFGGMYFNSKET